MIKVLPCCVIARDGRLYFVFQDSMKADDHKEFFPPEKYILVCYGQYDNAYMTRKI